MLKKGGTLGVSVVELMRQNKTLLNKIRRIPHVSFYHKYLPTQTGDFRLLKLTYS